MATPFDDVDTDTDTDTGTTQASFDADGLAAAIESMEVCARKRTRRQAISPGSEEYICLVQLHMEELEPPGGGSSGGSGGGGHSGGVGKGVKHRRAGLRRASGTVPDARSNAWLAFLASSPVIVNQGVMAVKSGYVFRRRSALSPHCKAFEMAKSAAVVDKERRRSLGALRTFVPLEAAAGEVRSSGW